MLHVGRSNTILYVDRWHDVVAFYRDGLGLAIEFENDWFVEFAVAPASFVSVADAARASVRPGDGAGLTLSWRVADVHAVRRELTDRGLSVGEVGRRWGADVLDLFDPSGNRLEFWSSDDPASGAG